MGFEKLFKSKISELIRCRKMCITTSLHRGFPEIILIKKDVHINMGYLKS